MSSPSVTDLSTSLDNWNYRTGINTREKSWETSSRTQETFVNRKWKVERRWKSFRRREGLRVPVYLKERSLTQVKVPRRNTERLGDEDSADVESRSVFDRDGVGRSRGGLSRLPCWGTRSTFSGINHTHEYHWDTGHGPRTSSRL